jgi:ribosomal protein S18 acetylase RimI-like enzyme
MTGDLTLRPVRYDSPDAVALTEQVQRFYIEIYGGPDGTPFTPEDFASPNGGFLVGYLNGRPVAMGGWRFAPYAAPAGADRAAEIKRMYVATEARGRGFGRAVLAALEDDARAAGADWMVLETGEPQVAAVALYRGCGYVDIAPYGFYADKPEVISLGKRL